jgi:probable HAF family extracellular repeat protein
MKLRRFWLIGVASIVLLAYPLYVGLIERWVDVLLFDAPQYQVVYIGQDVANAREFRAGGINDSGVVVGSASFEPGRGCTPFVYQSGALTYLPVRPNIYCGAHINNQGDVGGYTQGDHSDTYAFHFRAGATADDAKGWGQDKIITAINNRGVVVGYSPMTPASGAFMIRDGVSLVPSEVFGQTYFSPTDINNNDQIVGDMSSQMGSELGMFRDGQLRPIDDKQGMRRVRAINDHGEMAGGGAKGGKFLAFIAKGDEVHFLGTLRWGKGSAACDLNNNGQAVGYSTTSTIPVDFGYAPFRHAFIWQNGRMFSLNVLTGLDFDDYFADIKINNRGEIVATVKRNGSRVVVLLIPKKTYKN